jgi:hypothetical protein
MYLVMTSVISFLVTRLEKRMRIDTREEVTARVHGRAAPVLD